MTKTAAQKAQDAARDERYRRRLERRERQERDQEQEQGSDVWDFIGARLGIASPSDAGAALSTLRNLNQRIADMLNAAM